MAAPGLAQATPACRWCTGCRKGRCIRVDEGSCERPTDCDGPRHPLVSDPALCPLRSCLASECEKCRDLGSCMWTRQVVRSSKSRPAFQGHPPAQTATHFAMPQEGAFYSEAVNSPTIVSANKRPVDTKLELVQLCWSSIVIKG